MKKRGLGNSRGLGALISGVKKERALTAEALVATADGLPASAEKIAELAGGSKDKSAKSKADVKADKADKADKKAKTKKDAAKPSETTTSDDGEQVTLMQIDPNRLQSGKYQPRRVMDEAALSELASSIGQHGVMQPIVIRPLLSNEDKVNDGVTHEIIAGERRWRAAKMAGLTQIPAIERVLSDEIAIALALIENIQREDLNVLEQAAALQRFHTEFGMSHAMIADVVGKARATVTNLLRLNNLHDTVKGYMNEGLLDMGHARALLSLSDGQQPVIAKKIIDGQMTVRDAEKLVKSILNPEAKPAKADSHEVAALSQKLSDALGATVKLKQSKSGKGSLEIFFYGDDELNQLLSQLNVSL